MRGFCIDAMNQEKFAQLVIKAVEELPREFRTSLENVDIVIEDHPTSAQLGKSGLKRRETLLGLYEGVPQTERGSHYGMVLPDKITIFQKPIEANCRSDAELYAEVSSVLRHEIAHHFGSSETRLRQIEKG